MDFNLIDSSFYYTPKEKPIIHLPDGLYRETHVSSDFQFPPAGPPPFHNTFTETAPTTSTTTFFDNNPNHTPETNIPFCLPDTKLNEISFQKIDSMETMREMIFLMAMMQPVQIEPESVKLPKRKNVRVSKDPQSVAARHRREKISRRIRVLQRMVPGGTKLDTASMLDETVHYLKFLKKQLQTLELNAKSDHRLIGYGNYPVFGGFMQMLS